MIKQLYTLAFTHRHFNVSEIGKLHIDKADVAARLAHVKEQLQINELVYLSTCNRVEFFLVYNSPFTTQLVKEFIHTLFPSFTEDQVDYYTQNTTLYSKMEVVEHALRLASSIDSMIVGEREIITQVREAFEFSKQTKLSGDNLRILFRHTIETAKKVYTETKISQKPVSVVSIAYQQLLSMDVMRDSRVLAIGAGVTNTAMLRFLKKHGMSNFTIFNRSVKKAEALAEELGGRACPLNELRNHNEGFDILVTCTGAEGAIIDAALYRQLLQGDLSPKITIDLALPSDIADEVHQQFSTRSISIEVLQQISDANLEERTQEIMHVEQLIAQAVDEFRTIAKMRAIEVAMRPVPQMVKEIRSTAFNEVFKNELEQLDPSSLEVLEKVVGYMEKKYMSMPMIMAKEIMFKS